ncbi:hypothetical protein [Maridesulfovibrio sp.]|uniref:hypothetical protein n=1 Tax=Maridesulfovibrio sp. TaxID=2795000 RepID=UPI002A18E270|nr:hypothetical protein [Maridesulfovibrio sp.]
MKKILVLLVLLPVLAACARTSGYTTPFETGGKVYKLALMPWHSSTMTFDFRYRWTMTQALRDSCRQSGVFKLDWSAYPVNGGNVELLENLDSATFWERVKYGRYVPVVEKVRKATAGLGADLAVLYDVSADNAAPTDDDAMDYRADYVRIFLVDLNTGQVTVDFIRTNFLRKRAFGDIKVVTLRALNKWLAETKQ